MLLVLAVILTSVAALAPYLDGAPAALTGMVAVAGSALALAVVRRSRPGVGAVLAAVLTLINLVLAVRAFTTPH